MSNSSPRNGPARRAGRGAKAIPATLASALALLVALPGTAGATSDDTLPRHPDKDWMGSTIAAREGTGTGNAPSSAPQASTSSVEGVDVSSHNGHVPWSKLHSKGARFAYVKATEGTSYTNPYFASQYNGSYKHKLIRGSYHFALPSKSSGAAQARYFVKHGGGWSADGKTLPGALDLEYNPYGSTCYGKSHSSMVRWIDNFSKTYHKLTHRYPVIYTSTRWWKMCTGNSARFSKLHPLWLPRYGSSVGALPKGWPWHTFWQYTAKGHLVGDHNRFNGSQARLKALALGKG